MARWALAAPGYAGAVPHMQTQLRPPLSCPPSRRAPGRGPAPAAPPPPPPPRSQLVCEGGDQTRSQLVCEGGDQTGLFKKGGNQTSAETRSHCRERAQPELLLLPPPPPD